MTAVIFGVNGQDGYYLSDILQKNDIKVIGVSRSNIEYIIGDVSNDIFVRQLIRDNLPDYIFHLAANSTTRHDSVFENHKTISVGTLNILEAVYQYSKHTKVFISGSALQFVNTGCPISEKDSFEARDSYSMLRIQSVYTARYYRLLGVNAYVGYFFHHDSPLRHERHLNMKIILTALKIKDGTEKFLKIGNPEVIKEFNHAADMMNAIWSLVNQDKIFEATIGSGTGHSIREWIKVCFKAIGLDYDTHVKIDIGYNSDFKSMVSDPSTISSLGWKPLYNIDYLANDMIQHGQS